MMDAVGRVRGLRRGARADVARGGPGWKPWLPILLLAQLGVLASDGQPRWVCEMPCRRIDIPRI